MTKRYEVERVGSNRAWLRERLNEIAQAGGRIVSVTFQPPEPRIINGQSHNSGSGEFIIVVEFTT